MTMSGNQNGDADGGREKDPAAELHEAAREPNPWDLYRNSILSMAEEELWAGADERLIPRFDRELAMIWRDSPTALLSSGVAYYKAGKNEGSRRELDGAWEIWEGLLDADDPQTDTPLEILVLLRDLLRFTGRDEGSTLPNHFLIRPVYLWLCAEYGRWLEEGSSWKPNRSGEDPLKGFCDRCLTRAQSMKERDRAPLVLDREAAEAPP